MTDVAVCALAAAPALRDPILAAIGGASALLALFAFYVAKLAWPDRPLEP